MNMQPIAATPDRQHKPGVRTPSRGPSQGPLSGDAAISAAEAGKPRRVSAPPQLPSAILGKVVGISDTGEPLVDFPENPEPRPIVARLTCDFQSQDVDSEVLLVFAGGDSRQPVMIGVLKNPGNPTGIADNKNSGDNNTDNNNADNNVVASSEAVQIQRDGERVLIAADQEIVLQCGKASITLTRAGKILLRGTYLLNRSSGANRIKGGSVQIN